MKLKSVLFLIPIFFMFVFTNVFGQPAAPTNLTGTAGQVDQYSFVSLQWNAVQNAFKYNIYRKDGALADAGDFSLIHSGRLGSPDGIMRYQDANVEKNHTYSYYVTAEDFNRNESGPSNKIEVTVGNVPNPTNGGEVSGTVTDEVTHAALQGVYVSLISVTNYTAFVTQTDVNGNYTVTGSPGEYVVYFRAPQDYWPEFYDNAAHFWDATHINLLEGDSLTGIDAALAPIEMPNVYHISGKVADADGNPVKAMVHVFKVGPNSHYMHKLKRQTDDQGNYSIPVREGDGYVVLAVPLSDQYYPQYYNGKSSFEDADRINVHEDVTGIDFVLEARQTYQNGISGVVRDTSGNPLKGLVVAMRKDQDFRLPMNRQEVFTNDDGSYSFTNLVPGDYVLFAVPDGGYLPTFYKADGSETLRWRNADVITVGETDVITGIDFSCLPIPTFSDPGFALIQGTVTDNNGNPLGGVYIYALDNNHIVSYAISNPDGSYSMEGLPTGTFKIEADDFGYSSTQTQTVSTDYSSAQTVNLSMNPDIPTGIEENGKLPSSFSLEQNYPNPFNPTTVIKYSLPKNANVKLVVFNILGKKVATLVNGKQSAGIHQVQFNASNLPSGVYLYELNAGNFTQTKKMILMK